MKKRKQIYNFMKRHKLTQQRFAKLLGVSQATVHQVLKKEAQGDAYNYKLSGPLMRSLSRVSLGEITGNYLVNL